MNGPQERNENRGAAAGDRRLTVAFAALLASSVLTVLATIAACLAYRSNYGFDCGTGRLAALNNLFLVPVLLSVPTRLWVSRENAVLVRRLARKATLLPMAIWAGAMAIVLLMEYGR